VTPRSFYVKTKNIWDDKSWSDPVYFDMHGFDPDLFIDDDGKAYLTSTFGAGEFVKDPGYFSVFITQVDLETGNSLTDAKLLHVSTLPLDTPRLAEASHIFKKDGYYYLLTAEGGTELGHRAMIKRAKSLDGPWEENPSNPILHNGRDKSAPIQATGHADFVQTPKGDWYTVFLAIRPQAPANATGIPQLGRETFLAPMTWEKGAWPVINGGEVVGLDVPGVLYDLKKPKLWRDEFEGKLKDKAYYTPRTPYKQAVFLNERKGYARLKGNVYTLAQRETPACLFRKQTDLETVFSTELEFSPKTKKHEAGATIFLSLHYHNNIAITINPETDKPSIVARTRSGKNADLKETWEDLPSGYSGPVRLFIKAEREKYSLGYSLLTKAGGGKKGKEEWSETKYLAEVESKWLQAWLEGWQNFVGSFFGIYATGNGLPIREPADFKYIQTESQE
jgi:beta-xylosidase